MKGWAKVPHLQPPATKEASRVSPSLGPGDLLKNTKREGYPIAVARRIALYSLGALIGILAFFLNSPGELSAYMDSSYLGGFPGICEDDLCRDDGAPNEEGPPHIKRTFLEHQLRSPTCPTDLVYISIEYPENTGSTDLDAILASEMGMMYDRAMRKALELSCNDIFGCEGHCLPVGFEVRHHLFVPSQRFLSLFRVERFLGNFRGKRHVRGTVKYTFQNRDLLGGKDLKGDELFKDPQASIPLLWKEVDRILLANGNCPSQKLAVNGRVGGKGLKTGDFLLSSRGMTLALLPTKAKSCSPVAVDIPKEKLLELGSFDFWN
jgi:hypothetical protein